MRRILISTAIGEEKHWNRLRSVALGQAHYSWKLVTRMYERGFAAAGLTTQEIVRPEIYQTAEAARQLWLTADDVHVAVKPIEELRPLRFTKNFYICGWEFPEFSTQAYGSNPFRNHVRTLKSANAVLCWTGFTASNLKKYGVENVYVFPPLFAAPAIAETPVLPPHMACITLDTNCEPGAEQISDLRTFIGLHNSCTRFITVLNPWDQRKQLDRLVAEFVAATELRNDICLVVKLVIDNVGTTLGNINEILRRVHGLTLKSDKVAFVADSLSDAEMSALYRQADFYLCASSAEGLNMPLIECMLARVPSVSTWNSAMETYLNASCSIAVASSPASMKGEGHALHEFMNVTVNPPTEGAVREGVLEAAATSKAQRKEMGRQSQARAVDLFGEAAFARRTERILFERG